MPHSPAAAKSLHSAWTLVNGDDAGRLFDVWEATYCGRLVRVKRCGTSVRPFIWEVFGSSAYFLAAGSSSTLDGAQFAACHWVG